MRQLLVIFTIFISLSSSYQFRCGDFNYEECGYFNTGFNLKCHKFDNDCKEVEIEAGCKIEDNFCIKQDNKNEKETCKFRDIEPNLKMCQKVLIDDGCNVDDSFECDVININPEYYCAFDSDHYHCEKITKTCTKFMDDNCGGSNELKETDTKQCIKLPHYVYCSEFTIDKYCKVEVEDNTNKCTNRVDFDSSRYICDWNQERTSCTRRERDCSDQRIDDCEGFNSNCKKVYRGDAIPVCNIVTIESPKCKLNNGNCEDGEGLESYEECRFNEDYSKCQVKNKQCNKIISDSEHCKKGTIINTGAECLHLAPLSTYCTEVITNPSCKIENGECKYQDTKSTTKACKFDNYDSMLKCEFYEKDEKCNTGDNFNTCENGDDVPDEQICAPMGDTKCKLRPIECSDYKDQKSCEENTIKKKKKKCSWVTNFGGGSCKEYVVDNICTVKLGKCAKQDGKANSNNKECLFNIDKNECIERNKECKSYYDDTVCSENYPISDTKQCVKTGSDQYCKQIEVDENCKVDKYECKERDSNFDEKKGKCAFDDEEKRNSCKIRQRKCSEYTTSYCNNIEKCSLLQNSICLDTDEYCTCEGEVGKFKARSGVQLQPNEKCGLVIEGKAMICKKVEKECGDYKGEETCGQYNPPPAKLCYIPSDSRTCTEIKIDSQCSINENFECSGKGCKLTKDENDIDKCAYKDDDGSLLKIKRFILFALILLF